MKKSILLGLGAVAMAMGVGAATIQQKAVEAKATATLGQVIYLDVSDNGKHWWINNVGENNENGEGKTVIGMHAWGSGGVVDIRGHRVKGFNDYLFEFACNPSDYDGFLFFRGNGVLSVEGCHNQTPNVDPSLTEKGNVWKIWGDDNGAHNDWDFPYADRAKAYGHYFNTNIGCDPLGVSTPEGWAALSSEYDTLPDGAKAEVVAAVADAGSEQELPKAMATYDWAITHNPNLKDSAEAKFITGRTPNGAASVNGFAPVKSAETSAVVIAAIAGVGLAAAGTMIFVAKKHKEN